jgi:hypothetical protein
MPFLFVFASVQEYRKMPPVQPKPLKGLCEIYDNLDLETMPAILL